MSGYAVKYGLIVAAACIAYFLIMRLFSLHLMVELSLLNGVIMVVGIFFALRAYKSAKNGMINYLEGLGLSFVTALVAALAFGSFMILFAGFISDQFMRETTAKEFFGDDLSHLTLFGYVVVQLVISGALAGFVFMQYFKRPDHKLSND